MRTVEVNLWVYLLFSLLTVCGGFGTITFLIRFLRERSKARAYKTYLDAMIGMDMMMESLQRTARELFAALGEALVAYPYPDEADLNTGKTVLRNLESILSKDISEQWSTDLVAQMNRLYTLQEKYHVTREISKLRQAFEGAVAGYNVQVSKMVSVAREMRGYDIPASLIVKEF